jgi:hypothetical protein
MDDAIGDLGNIEEGTADVDVLLDVKSVLPRPPQFDVDDSEPFGNPFDPNRCPALPPQFLINAMAPPLGLSVRCAWRTFTHLKLE